MNEMNIYVILNLYMKQKRNLQLVEYSTRLHIKFQF